MTTIRTRNAAASGTASRRLMSQLSQRVEDLRRQPTAVAAARPGLIGAIFGFFFRLLILLGFAEGAIIWLTGVTQDLHGQPWGYVLHHAIRLEFGAAPFDPAWDEFLSANEDALPVLLPSILAAALTFYFLPSIIAARSKNVARLVVYPLNLLAGWSGIGWLVALVFSFVGGRVSAQAKPRSGGRTAPAGRSMLPTSGSTPAKAARPAAVKTTTRREPAIARRDSSQSWVRPR